MCGIAGIVSLSGQTIPHLGPRLDRMSELIAHRGPDGAGTWRGGSDSVGFAHRRLAIIDLSDSGSQPMVAKSGHVLVFNGEIYNYRELRSLYSSRWRFDSHTDSEVVLAGFVIEGEKVLARLRGMFSFAIWDRGAHSLFLSRDRFGIKPLYFSTVGEHFYFASEAKALLPFQPSISTSRVALEEYLNLQYMLGSDTLFNGIYEIPPAHQMVVRNGSSRLTRYWDIANGGDWESDDDDLLDELQSLVRASVTEHLIADVEVGAYVSGGFDSSLIYLLGAEAGDLKKGFHGRFSGFEAFDESSFASDVVSHVGGELNILDISHEDFIRVASDLTYFMDFPQAGPGAIPQYLVSEMVSKKVKVVLGGQGGDEIFGGYARYLIAHLEHSLGRAIRDGREASLAPAGLTELSPNLGVLSEYLPLLKEFWSSNLFAPIEWRYFDLVNRSRALQGVVRAECFAHDSTLHRFRDAFVGSYRSDDQEPLEAMMQFDIRYFLPSLLHVEDRVSMAHGIESRVPLLDHRIVELMAGWPIGSKFKNGQLKRTLKASFSDLVPISVLHRRDKMGFPVPLAEWSSTVLRDYFRDVLGSKNARSREYLEDGGIARLLENPENFSRSLWGILSLELWHQNFHDKQNNYKWED